MNICSLLTGEAEHSFDALKVTKERAYWDLAWDAGIVLYGTFTFVSVRNLADG